MKHIPNSLSCLRILLSLSLLLLANRPAWYFLLYLLCGLTDWADGFLARRLGAQSPLGARLDSLGDGVFWAAVLLPFFWWAPVGAERWMLWICAVVGGLRLCNLVLTRVRFHRWGMLHTLGNKAAGAALFLLFPVWRLLGYLPEPAAVVLFLLTAGSALEEGAILLCRSDYDPGVKSLRHRPPAG